LTVNIPSRPLSPEVRPVDLQGFKDLFRHRDSGGKLPMERLETTKSLKSKTSVSASTFGLPFDLVRAKSNSEKDILSGI
jgi:hypothetical protein